MQPESGSGTTSPVVHPARDSSGEGLVETLLARVDDIEEQLRAIPTAADEKALKELRRTIEVLSKRDPKFEERVTNKVDVVGDRVETVAKTVSTTAAALAAKDGEIAQLRRELEVWSGRVDTEVADLRRSLDPAALPEIKRALSALSQQKLPRGLEGRIEDLNAKLTMLAQRIDTVSSTVSTAAAGLARRDGDVLALRRTYEAEIARIHADFADLRRAIDPASIVELRQAVEGVSRQASAQQRASGQRLDTLTEKVDALVGHLDSLATSAAASATRISGSEEEISALRAYVEDDARRLGSLVTELKQTVATVSARVTALDEAEGEAARVLDERISGVSGSVDDLAARLHSLTAAVATTSERLGERDVELEGMERRLQEASSRVDSLVGDLMRALEEFPDPDSLRQALQGRVDEIVGQVAALEQLLAEEHSEVDDLASQLDSLATSAAATATRISGSEEEISALRAYVEDGASRLSSLVAELKQTVAALCARATALEEAEREAARVLDARVSGVSGSVDDLAGRLDSLTATVAATSERLGDRDVELEARLSEIAQRIEELAGRLDATEEGRDGTAAEVARLAAILEVERASLRARLDTLAVAQERAATLGTPEVERRLAGRFDGLESERTALAAELDRVSSAFDEERASVHTQLEAVAAALSLPVSPSNEESERRLADLAARLDALESAREPIPPELTRIRAAWSSHRTSLETRLDELIRRLDEVERRGVTVASDVSRATALWPAALRSLEARLNDVAGLPREPAPAFEEGSRDLLTGLENGPEQSEPPAPERARATDEEIATGEPTSHDPSDEAATVVGADFVSLHVTDP